MGLNERLRNIARTREKSALSKSPRVHISPDFLHIQAGLHPEVDGENDVWALALTQTSEIVEAGPEE